jgi:hypothetical protein
MLEWLSTITVGQWALIFAGLATIIQIVPIQIKPWDMLLGLIGKALNKNIEERLAQKDAEDARNHILRFGDEIKNKVRHSEEYFNQILDDITKYEKYCNEHKDFQNARTVQTTEIIKRVYKKCYEENDFL